MSYGEPREVVEGASYVDTLLRTYLRALAVEGPASACNHLHLVQRAWHLMLKSDVEIRRAKELLVETITELSSPEYAGILDANPPYMWLDIALNVCINERAKACKGPYAKYYSYCVHPRYRDTILSDPRERLEPWCCAIVADVALKLADERGYGKLAVTER